MCLLCQFGPNFRAVFFGDVCPIEGLFFVRSSVLEMPIDKLSFGSSNCCYSKTWPEVPNSGQQGREEQRASCSSFFNFFSLKLFFLVQQKIIWHWFFSLWIMAKFEATKIWDRAIRQNLKWPKPLWKNAISDLKLKIVKEYLIY